MSEEIEDALQLIVNTVEQIVNMKKGLKQTIIETVCTLRNLIVKLHDCRDGKIAEISKLEKQVNDLKAELAESRTAKTLGMPSIIVNYVPAGTTGMIMTPPGNSDGKHNQAGTAAWRVVSPGGGKRLYSEALGGGTTIKRFHLRVKSKGTQPPGKITELLRTKINPTEM